MTNPSLEYPTPSRADLDLQRFASIMLGNLAECYRRLVKKDAPQESTFDEFLVTIGVRVDEKTEDPMEMVRQAFSEDDAIDNRSLAESALGPIIASTIFILRALGEWTRGGDVNRAWSYMADGCYWAGVAVAGKGLGAAKKQDGKELASKGANAKKAMYDKIREQAFGLARKKRPPKNGWRSRLNAAETIEKDVNAFVILHYSHLHPVKLESIYDWLALMPDAEELFSRPQLPSQT